MSEHLIIILFWILGWILGWIILSIGHFIYKIKTDNSVNKKLHAWHAFWAGITSWVGIAFWISLYIVFIICEVNEWVENKLS